MVIAMLSPICSSAQSTLSVKVMDGEDKEPLIGVSVRVGKTGLAGVSDESGLAVIGNIPDGVHDVTFTYIGYETETKRYAFPLSSDAVMEVFLEEDESELGEIVVSTTRGTRSIKNVPTRVEFVSEEELDEKGSMKPGDIRMLLNESTGVITQQTSATSGNAVIRIQGLDGRYTQILKDGFPVFAGAASGLGLLQTPPLDLKRVEIIKGSTSTLYGGGAIAGLINLISKTPEEERDLRLHLNATTGNGFDASVFYGQRFETVGTTIFASYNMNRPYDPSDTGFTAIPKFDRYVLNPKLFLYLGRKTTMTVGLNMMTEDRMGGDVEYVKGRGSESHSYFESDKTRRVSSQLTFGHRFDDHNAVEFKNSVTWFRRKTGSPGYNFDGTQVSSFSELSYTLTRDKAEWVGGMNLWTDRFDEKRLSDFMPRDYRQTVVGAFAQNNWTAASWLSLETGLRVDHVSDYGWAALPRLSALFRISDKLSSRVGGGFGYKAPTIFTEDTERLQYKDVLPVDKSHGKLERSYGLNADVNYVTSFFDGDVTLGVNQLFFYTRLKSPLLLKETPEGLYALENVDGRMDSRGLETNVKVGYKDLHLYLGYTLTDIKTTEKGVSRENVLTPRHRFNSILMYEVEDEWKVGLEAYYYSPQRLSDGKTGRQYWICGLMVEKMWERFSVYANFENFTDRRQTRFDTIYTGSATAPVFRDIYAPLDGFVVNVGVKIKL